MNYRHYLNPRISLHMAGLMITLLTSGVALAALLVPKTDWLELSFSALGEGGTLAALIFTLFVSAAAIAMWLMARAMITQLARHGQTTAAKATIIVYALALCLFAVAIFPNDTQHMLHFYFSRALIVLFGTYALVIPALLTSLARRQQITLYSVALTAVVCCVIGLVNSHFSFVIFESIAALLSLYWLCVLCSIIDTKLALTAATTAPEASPEKSA